MCDQGDEPNMEYSETMLKPRFLYQTLLHVALLALAVEVAILIHQKSVLRESLFRLSVKPIAAGDSLKTEGLELMTTQPRIESNSRHLLFLFTTSCRFCKQNIPNWEGIAGVAGKRGINIQGICLDKIVDKDSVSWFVVQNRISYPVYFTRDADQFRKNNNISGVPQTILCSPSGIVEKCWPGALTQKTTSEILDAVTN